MTPLVELLIEEEEWLTALPELSAVSEDAAQIALEAAGQDPSKHSVSVLACDDARIASLNADHRGKPVPTNVLSWPTYDLTAETPGGTPQSPPCSAVPGQAPLGDVALALQTCVQEAETAAKPLKFHVTHLILHGCLHLLGYGHDRPEDAVVMEGIETRAMMRHGWPDPYA